MTVGDGLYSFRCDQTSLPAVTDMHGCRPIPKESLPRSRLSILPIAAAFALTAVSMPALADGLSGNWSGGGYVKPRDGQREKVSCRVKYTPQGSSVVAVSATCASASTTIQQTGQLSKVSATKYVGEFYNSQYDISGRIRVTISGGSQTVTFSSDRGSGSMQLSRR